MDTEPVNEGSPLLKAENAATKEPDQHQQQRREMFARWSYFVVWTVVSALVLTGIHTTVKRHRRAKRLAHNQNFPHDFVWGAATSAYQVEGAAHEDGRGLSIWDTFSKQPGAILDDSNGDVACDHYHRMESDVQMMKNDLGLKAYRFSISWPRIFPNGTGQINPEGLAFYNRLIDTLLANNIEPWITLYHWDLPQALEDEYGGWLSRQTVDAFAEYARTCFAEFGDRVKHWITINESWTIAVNGYNNGVHAPGRYENASTEPYIVAHHLILAHAKAAKIYHDEFAHAHHGKIGISHCADYRYPLTKHSARDEEAAQRAMVFQLGWFADPLYFGDYPKEMRQRLGRRLPTFTRQEQKLLVGSTDFIGLNHYSSLLASQPLKRATYAGYWADIDVDFSSKPNWRRNDMGWPVVPDGCRQMLKWISHRYHYPTIYMTENGSADGPDPTQPVLQDEARRQYLEDYLRACAQAIRQGVNLKGYFAWSVMDNFEWQFGYQRRFGLVRVDFETLQRTPKLSANWFQDIILANGNNIVVSTNDTTPDP